MGCVNTQFGPAKATTTYPHTELVCQRQKRMTSSLSLGSSIMDLFHFITTSAVSLSLPLLQLNTNLNPPPIAPLIHLIQYYEISHVFLIVVRFFPCGASCRFIVASIVDAYSLNKFECQ